MRAAWCLALALAWLATARPAAAHSDGAVLGGVGLDDRTGQKVPLDTPFSDEKGVKRPLSAYLDRPALVLPVYYSCRHICADMLDNLAGARGAMGLKAGRDYRVLAFGIDETEGPADARQARALREGGLPGGLGDGWTFLTGDKASILRFTGAAGYRFRRTAPHEFSHPSALIVLSADGTVIRYLYGPQFLPFDLAMAVTEATKGAPSVAIRKALAYCFAFDPESGSYTFRAARALTLGVFGAMGAGLFLLLRRGAGRKA
ncbi:MAG: hypothetical protein A2X32_02055 [Elusimicrobia bacterium GWC2_64_44]|nr:MAG: hypothetical protein A2X32_02055 [Elusimicrobia bacterium GWC2_64_44]